MLANSKSGELGGDMPQVRKVLETFMFGVIPIVFIWLFGAALVDTWGATKEAPTFSDAYIIVASGAAGVVGAAFATAVGVETNSGPGAGGGGGAGTGRTIGVAGVMGTSALRLFPRTPEQWKKAIGYLYIVTYIALGGLALIVWITKSGDGTLENPNLVPDFITALAAGIWGIGVALATRAYSS